jgi:hypothetical protein
MNCCDEYGDCRQGRDCPVRKQSTSNPKDFWDGYVPEPTRTATITTDMALDLALEALEYIHEGANNQGPHTGISWRCVAVKAEPAIKAIKLARLAPVQEPVAWRFTGIAGFKRFVTDAQHKGLPLEVRAWYEPFKCASCTTPPAAQRHTIDMAREAGIRDCTCSGSMGCLKAFEALVRADERDACAKEAESWDCHLAAAEIRARGNT